MAAIRSTVWVTKTRTTKYKSKTLNVGKGQNFLNGGNVTNENENFKVDN